MGLKDDIKSNLTRCGSTMEIQRTPVVTEVFDTEPIYQASKPFRLEHIVSITSPFDSILVVGDIGKDTLGDDTYLIVHSDAEIVNREIISRNIIAYKTNCTITASRKTSAGKSYNPTVSWTPFVTAFPAVVDDTAYAAKLDDSPIPYQNIQEKVIYLYVPTNLNIGVGDRVHIDTMSAGNTASGSMNYEVTTIDYFTFLGISILHTKEDSRS